MIEGLIEELGLLAENYGLLGLFVGSFVMSTVLPLSVELLFVGGLGLGLGLWESVAVVTVGTTLGGFTDYLIGYGGGSLVDVRVRRYEHLINEGGAPIIFIAAFTPLPYELFSLSSGFLGMDLRFFLSATAAGRFLRFSMMGLFGMGVLGLVEDGRWPEVSVLVGVGVFIVVAITYLARRFLKSRRFDNLLTHYRH